MPSRGAKAKSSLAYLGYLGGAFSLCAQALRFSFSSSTLGSFAGWFGAPVIDLGFAADIITFFEPLHVALQLIRFGSFFAMPIA